MDPSLLFTSLAGKNTAVLETNIGDKSAYVEGFLDAAEIMAKLMLKNEVPVDIVFYPAFYNLRHGLELGFKVLLAGYREEDEDKSKPPFHHRLRDLWEPLRTRLPDTSCMYSDHEFAFQNQEINYINWVVEVIHEVDPNGEHGRYDEDHDGKPTLKDAHVVNLEVFHDICARCSSWMSAVLNERITSSQVGPEILGHILPGYPKG